MLGGPLEALVRVHRLQALGVQERERIRLDPILADVHRTDAVARDERIGSGEPDVVDLGIDVAVASEFGHERLDSAGNGHLAVEDREDVLDGSDGLRRGVSEKSGDAGKERIHLGAWGTGFAGNESENLPLHYSKKWLICQPFFANISEYSPPT